MELGDRGYERGHINQVLAAIRTHFPKYFATFASTPDTAREAFEAAVSEWLKEQPDYEAFLDPGALEEYEDDPDAFKGAVRSRCPIIRKRPVNR
jgi:hypothetical protein